MKNQLFFLTLLVGVSLPSCTNNMAKEGLDPLTAEMKSQISSEIMEVSDLWIQNNINMDANKAIEFWSKSPDLIFAENGQFFANRDSIYSILNYWYSSTKNFKAGWIERKIIPISSSIALMSGEFYYKLNLHDGGLFQGTNIFTGVFLKENGQWSVIQGQETVKEK